MNDDLITTAEAATLLGLDEIAVYNMIEKGELDGQFIGGKQMVSREDVFEIFDFTCKSMCRSSLIDLLS